MDAPMNVRILATFLCLASLGTGCVIYDNDNDPCCNTPPPGQRGDVTFQWTFSGGRCVDVPQIKAVQIRIGNERLANDGYYPCRTNGYDGIVLHDFVPASYNFTIQAIDYNDRVIYSSAGNFVVNGNTRVNVDLTPEGSPGSYAYISWRFPANVSCSQAGVARVQGSIDGGQWADLSCENGRTAGIQTADLGPGPHRLELVALGADNQPYYYTNGTFETVRGQPRSYSFDFWAVGGAALGWQLTADGRTTQSCAVAGITQVFINFRDVATGQLVYGEQGDRHACTDAPVTYNFLPPGDYYVYIQASGPGGVYLSNATTPPVIRVTAFRHVHPNDALSVLLQRR
jgi:hypothetical protein